MIIPSASPESITRLPRQQRLHTIRCCRNLWLIKQEGKGINCSAGGCHDSRLAMAHDTCADSSSLDGKDVKSQRFATLVFLGRGGCESSRRKQATAGIQRSEQPWRFEPTSGNGPDQNGAAEHTGTTSHMDVRDVCPECLSCK